MTRPSDRLDRMRIASPCSVGWERMVGDDRVRFCDQCHLNVYNISEMTGKQVEALIKSTEGRLCARLFRRADGTILTQDCPVGLRAVRRRVSRITGAAFTAVIGFCMNVFGQAPSKVCMQDAGNLPVKIKRTQEAVSQSQDDHASIMGTILDPSGAAVAGATITLINDKSKAELTRTANEEGSFQFPLLEAGSYTLKVEMPGFVTTRAERINVKPDEATIVKVNLEIQETDGGVVGIILMDVPLIDLSTTSVTTSITDDQFKHLPVPE